MVKLEYVINCARARNFKHSGFLETGGGITFSQAIQIFDSFVYKERITGYYFTDIRPSKNWVKICGSVYVAYTR